MTATLTAFLALSPAGLFGPDIEEVDPAKSAAENAAAIADRFAAKYPDRCLVIGVFENGVRTVEARGTLPGGRPVDASTRFEIGSVTKTFTGLLLADAVTRGEVTLDTTLAGLLPERKLSESVAAVTLRQLATHRSGLPRMPPKFSPADPNNPFADVTADAVLSQLADLKVKPTEGMEYSNLGAGLVADALAERAGTTVPVLMRDRVFRPLSLTQTDFAGGPAGVVTRPLPPLAPPHRGQLAIEPWRFGALAGCGGVRSSAADMLDYAEFVLRPSGPLADAARLATTPHETRGQDVGLFWILTGDADAPVLWHNGATYGTTAYLAVDRAKGRCVLVMKNSTNLFRLVASGSLPDRIGRALIELPAAEPRGA